MKPVTFHLLVATVSTLFVASVWTLVTAETPETRCGKQCKAIGREFYDLRTGGMCICGVLAKWPKCSDTERDECTP